MNGTLQPGTRLAMAKLRQLYAIGLSPLREALSRLVGEGLVISEGQRGFRVAPFSREDLDDLTFLWQIVSEGTLRSALARRDENWEAAVVAAFHVLERRCDRVDSGDLADRAAFEEAQRAFHLTVTAGAGSPRSALILGALYDQARRYRLLFYNDTVDLKAAVASYRELVDHLLAYEIDDAVANVRRRLTTWRDEVRRRAGW